MFDVQETLHPVDPTLASIAAKLHLDGQQSRAWQQFCSSWSEMSSSLQEAESLVSVWSQLNDFRLDDNLHQIAHLTSSRLTAVRVLAHSYSAFRKTLSERQCRLADRYLYPRCIALLKDKNYEFLRQPYPSTSAI